MSTRGSDRVADVDEHTRPHPPGLATPTCTPCSGLRMASEDISGATTKGSVLPHRGFAKGGFCANNERPRHQGKQQRPHTHVPPHVCPHLDDAPLASRLLLLFAGFSFLCAPVGLPRGPRQLQSRIATFAPQRTFRFTPLGLAFCFFRFSNTHTRLKLRSLRFHSPRFCRVAVFLIQTNVSLSLPTTFAQTPLFFVFLSNFSLVPIW